MEWANIHFYDEYRPWCCYPAHLIAVMSAHCKINTHPSPPSPVVAAQRRKPDARS